jgi:hypothetical protein
VNVALLEPEGTVTEAGTVIDELFDERATLAPVVPLRVTVHVLELSELTIAGEHARLLTVKGELTPTEPPVAVTETASPPLDAPKALVTPIVDVLAAADMVTETFATTPF